MLRSSRINTMLYCQPWHEVVAFYGDTLGLPVHARNSWMVEFSLGPQIFLSVADASRTSVAPGDGRGLTISLQVPALSEWQRLLEQQEVPCQPVEHADGARGLFFRDPAGNRLEVWQPPDPETAATVD